MPQALEIITEVRDNTIPTYRKEQIKSYLALYEGTDVCIRIGKPKRSTLANSYYWGLVIEPIRIAMIDAGIGFIGTPDGISALSPEALHEFFKRKYLPARVAEVFGEPVSLTGSTTALDSTEFFYYVEAIKYNEQVLQLGIQFQEPESKYKSYNIAEIQ